jgi:hypothetical protein
MRIAELKTVSSAILNPKSAMERVGPQNNPDDLIQEAFELRNIFKSRIRKLRGEE